MIPTVYRLIGFYMIKAFIFNPFHAIDLILYPLKTSENQRLSDVFKEYRKRQEAWNGLMDSAENHDWKTWFELSHYMGLNFFNIHLIDPFQKNNGIIQKPVNFLHCQSHDKFLCDGNIHL